MLLFSPIVGLMALYCAVVYGILYLLYTTFTFVFEENYDFSSANVGLTYIASGIGMILGLVIIGGVSDRLLKSYAAKGDGELKPEYRLLPLMYSSWLVPIGLFIYGWTAQYKEQWAIPLFGTLLFGVGIISALICVQVGTHFKLLGSSLSFVLGHICFADNGIHSSNTSSMHTQNTPRPPWLQTQC